MKYTNNPSHKLVLYFHSILFILFYFIHSIYSILFYLFYSIYSILFHSILLYSIYSILLYSTPILLYVYSSSVTTTIPTLFFSFCLLAIPHYAYFFNLFLLYHYTATPLHYYTHPAFNLMFTAYSSLRIYS
jgi:hypothetical protein